MTLSEIQAAAYREGALCANCPTCRHVRHGRLRWRECLENDPEKCHAVRQAPKKRTDYYAAREAKND